MVSVRFIGLLAIFGMFGMFGGCAHEPRPTQAPETSLVGTPPKDEPTEEAGADPEVQADEETEELRVELVMLEKDNPYQTDTGVRVELREVSPITFALMRADEEVLFELARGAEYAEGRTFGSVWAVSKDGGIHLQLRHDPAPPLSPEEAKEIALQELGANLGCEGELRQGEAPRGTMKWERVDPRGEVVCEAIVGLHTGRVVQL